jgi:hypothetical protein
MTTDPQQPESPSPAVSADAAPVAAVPSVPTDAAQPASEEATGQVSTDTSVEVPRPPASEADIVAATSVVIDTAHPPIDVLQAQTSKIMAEADAAMQSEGGAITRVREKMASASESPTQQPDHVTPQDGQGRKPAAVEIPQSDDLDESVEAEISAALSENAGAMPEAVIVPGGESDGDSETKTVRPFTAAKSFWMQDCDTT